MATSRPTSVEHTLANWFIGFPLRPDRWFDAVLADVPPSLQRSHPEDLHVTVAFLGAVGEAKARAAWATLDGWAATPLDAVLGPVKPFGNVSRPSALAVVLAGGNEAVSRLVGELRGPMFAAANVPSDPRAPLPHVTVARPRRRASAAERQRAVAWAASVAAPLAPVRFDQVALYTWSDDRRERQFRVVTSRTFW